MPKIGTIEIRLPDKEIVLNKYYVVGIGKFAVKSTEEMYDNAGNDLDQEYDRGKYYLCASTEAKLIEGVKTILKRVNKSIRDKKKIILYSLEAELPDKHSTYFGTSHYELKFGWEILNVYSIGTKTYIDQEVKSKFVSGRDGAIDGHHSFIDHTDKNEKFFVEFEKSIKMLIIKVNKFFGDEQRMLISIKNNIKL